MMNTLSFLSILACFTYFVLGLYILLHNRQSALNRSFFYLSLVFAVYAFAYAFYYVSPDYQAMIHWHKISSVGWTLFPAFLLNFTLILTRHKLAEKPGLILPLMLLPGVVFLYLNISSGFYVLQYLTTGNYPVIIPNDTSLIFWLYILYLLAYTVLSFLLVLRWRMHTRLNKEKKQANVLLIIFVIIFVINISTNVVFPLARIQKFPDIAHITSLIMVIGIAYAILRYRLMMITPSSAANLVISRMNEYLFFTDKKGKIIRTNDFTVRNLGFTSGELEGKFFYEITDKESKKELPPLNTRGERFRLALVSRQGGKIPVSMISNRVMDKFDDLVGFVVVGYDTTQEDQLKREIEDRKLIEFELTKAKERAEESDKLKSSFLANVSHELRTPLNGILGFTEILKMEVEDPALIEIVEYIDQSGNRLLGTLNSLIDLSLIETNKNEIDKQMVNVSEMVKQKTELYKSYASSKNLYLETRIDSPQLKSRTDPRLLGHVLNNLLDNAIKYTEEGGISVYLTQESLNQRNYLRLKVEDTGIGIDESHYIKIFESFRQISEGFDREYEGIGIGLSICKNFIDLLGGEIWVESRLNKGSSFYVRIPAWEGNGENNHSSGPAEEQQITKPVPRTSRPYLLIVEDEKTNREYMKYTLSESFEVDTTINGHKAFELAEKNKYDLIFMDVNLGREMSGVQALKKIRNLDGYQNTPVAAVTASVMKKQQEEFYRNGFTHYLAKPFKRRQLLDLAKKMLATRKGD